MCGGTVCEMRWYKAVMGLSPRVRGNPSQLRRPHPPGRSIPACAGEPPGRRAAARAAAVYPRVCGGTRYCRPWPGRGRGLSPRVRGNRWTTIPTWQHMRSIPACAGEPRGSMSARGLDEVYPRVCGGTADSPESRREADGLSPRVRGNHVLRRFSGLDGGSIPACAGEPPPPQGAAR